MPMRILVVDDEPDLELLIRQRFRRQVRAGEMAFCFAGDGLEALDRLGEDDGLDIVLSDINMPRMDGLTLLARLREEERPLKVVIVSAYGDMQNIRTAMNRGAFDFITKPIDFEDLEVTIRKTDAELGALRQAGAQQQQLTALRRELEIASRIQLSSLPPSGVAFPERADFDLHAAMTPAQEVGGDFYDYFLVDEHRLGLALGDVAGKGLGAALFMAITRTLLRATALQGLGPAACVRHVNRVLHPESVAQMFVTLVYAVLDTRTGALTYCNAGHNLPYVLRRGEVPAPLERTGGLGLCLAADFDYQERRVTLAPGDGLLLYTDGVPEAVDGQRRAFDDERLAACLAAADEEASADVIRSVLCAVEAFTGGAPPSDDITMLALRFAGTPGAGSNGNSRATAQQETSAR